MRKLNSILTAFILVLFTVHAVLGALNLMNVAPIITKPMAWIMAGLIAIHTVISCALTIQSIKVIKKTGAPYFKQNLLFWARRISGLAIMLFIVSHITLFMSNSGGAFRLNLFDAAALTNQIMLVLSIAVHVITNVKPMLISFGIRKLKPKAGDILFFISVILVLAAIGFIVYFIRWNFI